MYFEICSRFDIEQSANVECTMRYTCIDNNYLKFKSTNSTNEFDAHLRYTNTKSTHRKRTKNRTVCFGCRRWAQRREKCAEQYVWRVKGIQCMSWLRIANDWCARAKPQFLRSNVLGWWAIGGTRRSSFGRTMFIRDSKWVDNAFCHHQFEFYEN